MSSPGAVAGSDHGPDSTPLIAIVKNSRCAHCQRSGAELETKFKRCTGCLVTVYCSKQCQKNAWASHEYVCRPSAQEEPEAAPNQGPVRIRLPGHPQATGVTLSKAMSAWVYAHELGMVTLVTATTHLEPRDRLYADPTSSAVFVVHIEPRPSTADFTGESTSPAETFKITNFRVTHRTEFEAMMGPDVPRGAWDSVQALCDGMKEGIRELSRPRDSTVFSNVLPTAYLMRVQDVTLFAFRPLPICRLPGHPNGVLDMRTRLVFEDLIMLCMSIINSGSVIHSDPNGMDRMAPAVGRMIRRRKKWVWQMCRNWNQWDVACRATGLSGALRSGLSPREVWFHFYAG